MDTPKHIYDAAITYRTPSGKRVRFHSKIAAYTLGECEVELGHRLLNEVQFGRRKVAEIIGEFSATIIITMQIGR